MFTQLCGVAMEKKLERALATKYIGDVEEAFVESRDKKPDLWMRYIGDMFMIWSDTNEQLDEFLLDLNRRQRK